MSLNSVDQSNSAESAPRTPLIVPNQRAIAYIAVRATSGILYRHTEVCASAVAGSIRFTFVAGQIEQQEE